VSVITIVDYGMGNLGSISNMLRKIGVACRVSSDVAAIAEAEKLILPGVGAFDAAMQRIDSSGLRPALERRVLVEKVPVLGICLGMQLLAESSEEGKLPGLGWIPAEVLDFRGRVAPELKVPHMGWNVVVPSTDSALTRGLAEMVEPRFYFVHSYFVRCRDPHHSILRTRYGLEFDSGVHRDNIYGVQFHPEKSHRFGMTLLQNFASL
jgi:glutamine amidotransferase